MKTGWRCLGAPPARSQLLTFIRGRSQGSPCEARSFHGYSGIEDQVMAGITDWLRVRR